MGIRTLNELSPLLSEQMKIYGENVINQLKKAPFNRIIRWTIFLQYMTAKQGEEFKIFEI